MISETMRLQVRQRAKNRCEYCLSHQDFVMGRLQIDHIFPEAKGGTDDENNLCLACELCNQYKWTKIDGVDPLTGTKVQLFNPRQQRWNDNFSWNEDGTEILGLTPAGRVTIASLKLNNSFALTVRKNWVKAGWHPPTL
ncbi:MAG: HNH endonuclease signature motif containing protein [Acidobacteriota bacterium]